MVDLRAMERWMLRGSAVLFSAGGLLLAHLHLTRGLIVYLPLSVLLLWRWGRKMKARSSLLYLTHQGMKGSITIFAGAEKFLLETFGGRDFFIPWSAIQHWEADTREHRIRIASTDGRTAVQLVLPVSATSRAGRRIGRYYAKAKLR